MGKAKNKARLEAENRLLRRFRASDGIASVVNSLIKWGAIVLCARYVQLSIAALAGKETLANIGIGVLTDIRISEALAWLLATSGVAYGAAQKRIKKNTVVRLQARNQMLEQQLDPGRTSSLLTPQGDTRPEDK